MGFGVWGRAHLEAYQVDRESGALNKTWEAPWKII